MQYDPIKRSLGKVFNRTPFLRILFYKLLDLLLLRAWHIKRELRKWKKNIINDVRILDAGAGFGQYTYFMSSMNNQWHITSIDLKPEQVDDCNSFFSKIGRKKRVNFEVADLTQYKQKETFNLIVCVDVMEHIEKDTKVFENFHESLKSGGVLLISTPSDQGGSDVHDDNDKSFIDEHVRDGYNVQDITDKLKSAGFSTIEVLYTYGNPGKLSWKMSMKYPLTMLGISKLFFILLPFYYIITYPIAFVLNYFDLYGSHKSGTGLKVKAVK